MISAVSSKQEGPWLNPFISDNRLKHSVWSERTMIIQMFGRILSGYFEVISKSQSSEMNDGTTTHLSGELVDASSLEEKE